MLEEIVEFIQIVGKLKDVKRRGWVTGVGIKNPESVADHAFRTAILAMVISDMRKLNTEKIVRMALLHELQEAIMGDWDIKMKEKFGMMEFERKERESIKKVLSKLPKNLKTKYMKLWEELEEGKTKESKLFEEIDKLEMAFQTLEYKKKGYDKNKLEGFWKYSEERLNDKELKSIFELLKKVVGRS